MELEKKTIDVNVIGFTVVADWVINYFIEKKAGFLLLYHPLPGLEVAAMHPRTMLQYPFK